MINAEQFPTLETMHDATFGEVMLRKSDRLFNCDLEIQSEITTASLLALTSENATIIYGGLAQAGSTNSCTSARDSPWSCTSVTQTTGTPRSCKVK
jgi:hypothetical protein